MELERLIEWHEGMEKAFKLVFGAGLEKRVEIETVQSSLDMHAETARILRTLDDVRRECDFGPLRELNDGRPDVLCLDFTGPADTLRRLAGLLGGGK